ncbi:MAG TPA: GntR family transcriptional regulator [Candidatus Limiplasma sp.]|nr:GntR family transcriptional regulator [Candidatus Limiplasma sp.]HRX07857.1 GntR family transcriptional regulator [Candidatus Limiplasma sp.]
MRLSDKVYSALKNDVFLAKYKPNVLIVEGDIAKKYGVSKVTAGEALHRLCSEGHLTSYPRSGYMVTLLTPQEMKQLNRMRIAVEVLTVEIICQEASDEAIESLRQLIKTDFQETDNVSEINNGFHMALANLTHNMYIIPQTESLLGSASRVEQSVKYSKERWQDYHVKLIEALKARDMPLAKAHLVADINQR